MGLPIYATKLAAVWMAKTDEYCFFDAGNGTSSKDDVYRKIRVIGARLETGDAPFPLAPLLSRGPA